MRGRETRTKTTQALWRIAGDEGITIEQASKRLLDECLERERLERERRKGKIVTEICLDGNTRMVALSEKTMRVLWREAGKARCTIDEIIENWLEQWFNLHVHK